MKISREELARELSAGARSWADGAEILRYIEAEGWLRDPAEPTSAEQREIMSNERELIKRVAVRVALTKRTVAEVVAAIMSEGWLRNPGEPIDPKDIRKGDRIRIEWEDGSAQEVIANGPRNGVALRYLLLDRPPTNAERIEAALRLCNYAGGPEYIAQQLDELGVKAPEDDDG